METDCQAVCKRLQVVGESDGRSDTQTRRNGSECGGAGSCLRVPQLEFLLGGQKERDLSLLNSRGMCAGVGIAMVHGDDLYATGYFGIVKPIAKRAEPDTPDATAKNRATLWK